MAIAQDIQAAFEAGDIDKVNSLLSQYGVSENQAASLFKLDPQAREIIAEMAEFGAIDELLAGVAEGGKKAIERMKALNDLQKMLDEKAAYKAAPETTKKLRQMMDLYNSYKATKDQFEGIGGSQFLINMNKEETIIKMRQLSEFNENTQSAYNVLFGRLLGD